MRMIVNHNANNDEIYVTLTILRPPALRCPAHQRSQCEPDEFKTLYSYLLVSKATGKTLDFYTDLSCICFASK